MSVYVKHHDSYVVKVFVSHCGSPGSNPGMTMLFICLNIKNVINGC